MKSASANARGRGAGVPWLFGSLFGGFLSVVVAGSCLASTITLQWDPTPASELAGYKIYYSTSAVLPFSGLGAVQGASPVDVANQTTATISGLDPGQNHYFAVTAYSTSGAESSYSDIVEVPELIPPAVTITSPANNATATGTLAIGASASDNVGVTRVEFYVNGELQASQSTAPYLMSWNAAALASGTYAVSAKAYDAAGNVGDSAPVSVSVVHDGTAPAVSITGPASNAAVGGTVQITASATDNVGVTRVEFYQDGAPLCVGNLPPYSCNWNTAALAGGSYTLSALAYDAAGNIGSSANVPVTVGSDSTPPVLSAFSLPATASSLAVPVSSFAATDNVGVTGFLVTESTAPPAAGAASWSATAPVSFTFGGYGSRTAYAWVKDAAGNVSGGTAASVVISQLDGSVPVVTVLSPADGARAGASVTVSAFATDNVGVVKLELYLDGELKSTQPSASYSWKLNTRKWSNGAHVIKVLAYDAAGNWSTRSVTVYK